MIKPAELIDITGVSHLSLSARRTYNALIANAFGVDMGTEGHEWTIQLAELRKSHTSNDRIEDDIVALMQTVVTVRLGNGKTRRVQLLGGNERHWNIKASETTPALEYSLSSGTTLMHGQYNFGQPFAKSKDLQKAKDAQLTIAFS